MLKPLTCSDHISLQQYRLSSWDFLAAEKGGDKSLSTVTQVLCIVFERNVYNRDVLAWPLLENNFTNFKDNIFV